LTFFERGEKPVATLATNLNRYFWRGLGFEQTAKARAEHAKAGGGVALRAFPNEDIYFHVKVHKNSQVVREADPSSRGTCWKVIGSVVAAVVLLIGVLLPGAYGLLAGYQIQTLRQESVRLATERGSLEVSEAELISPQRMEQLAKEQQFIDPPAQKVVYLENAQSGTVAMNQK
jgi:hypothetical protein